MMKILYRMSIVLLLGMLVLLLLAACGDGGNQTPASSSTAQPTPTSTAAPAKNVVITIGNLTDLTGVSSNAQAVINMAMDDLIKYFNDENLIPGVELKVVAYDGQFDPARDISGYQWLREKGADLIVTGVPPTVVTLEPRANEDHMVLFSLSGDIKTIEPPGYVFAIATLPTHEALTMLTWISENDWDWKTKGPAKIGGASWDDPNSISFLDAAKAYAEAHPDQFEWAGAHYTPVGTFTWGPEVQALKDCDYVFPNTVMPTFVKAYRNAGYTGKFIGTGVHAAFLHLIDDAKLWPDINGMLFDFPSRWWNEKGPIVDLRKKLLFEYHPGKAEDIVRSGSSYNAFDNLYVMLDIIRKAVEAVGPANFNSQALYDAAQSYSLMVDGVDLYSFSKTKRYAANYYGIYRANGAKQDLFRADPKWYPAVTEP